MFVVTVDGRRAGSKKFLSYEEARRYARSRIRKRFGWTKTSNPPINVFGYQVKRLASTH